jgi:hypothetical protein
VLRQVHLDSYGRWLALKVDNEVASRVAGKSKANRTTCTIHMTRDTERPSLSATISHVPNIHADVADENLRSILSVIAA